MILACEDLSREKDRMPSPAGVVAHTWRGPVKAGALFPESEVMHHSGRNGTSRNNVTPTSN